MIGRPGGATMGRPLIFFKCTQTHQTGDRLPIGPYHFEVIHTPGHAADGIVLYHRPTRILISADTLWESDMAVITPRIEGSAAVYNIQQSLNRLAELKVDKVFPGHGEPFEDFKGALNRSLQRVAGYLADPRKVGFDLLKKITVYTVLMNKTLPEREFYDYLMQTIWFPETVDYYFDRHYARIFDETMNALLSKNVLQINEGMITTTVKP